MSDKIVYCTTCKGRTDHLSRTLPQNLADNPDARFVVLSYNDQDGLSDYLKTNHEPDIDSGRVVVYQYRAPVPFRMAHAKNLSHRLGIMEGGDILVNLDADNWTNTGFTDYLGGQFQDRNNIFCWSRMVKDGEGRLPRGISGRIAMRREAFLTAGGYDEKYWTHSPDDKDMNHRLCSLGYEPKEIAPKYLKAILHKDKMRFRDYPQVAESSYEDFQIQTQGSPVANAGRVGCGVVYKNFRPEPIRVSPIATKVFGIGLHKTATTSLHRAFELIGFRSGHWENAHWAKAVYTEITQDGKSPTLERFYALSDLPIPLLFPQLDAAYPGSKFILTVRDEWNWLTSVRKHWQGHTNKFRKSWNNDPFSHQVHRTLYGRCDFDPTVFLERYRRHNAEVLEYFHGRNDLLVMDMDRGHGWNELCGFLNVAIPSRPYPRIDHRT